MSEHTDGTTQALAKASPEAIRWLAGLLEGEGFFVARKKGGITVGVAMTDRDVVESAIALLAPGKKLYAYESWYQGKQHKTRYQTVIGGGRAAGWMMTLYGLMHARRRDQIRKALAHWRTVPLAPQDRTRCPRGHIYAIDSTIKFRNGAFRERRCRPCFNLSRKRRRQAVLA